MKCNNRVFITGVGSITTCGVGVDSLWKANLSGRASHQEIPESWSQISYFNSRIYLPLPRLDYSGLDISRVEQLLYDPTLLNLFLATRESLNNARIKADISNRKNNQLKLEGFDPYRLGVFIGSGNGGIKSLLDNYRSFLLDKHLRNTKDDYLRNLISVPEQINNFVVAKQMPNAVADGVGIKYGIKGTVQSFYNACAASTIAIGHAFNNIKHGHLDCAITGGTEYATDNLGGVFKGFDLSGTLAKEVEGEYRGPFDTKSNGFLFSDGGAGSIILESEQSVSSRGVEPIAEITGFSESFDAHNLLAPLEEGIELERMLNKILDISQLRKEEIHYINAHGTGTKNDLIEEKILNRVFPSRPYISSSKGVIGHTLGASGSLETIITALSIKNKILAPSGSLKEPTNNLNIVKEKTTTPIQNALNISSSFGGHNAALLLAAV